MSLISISWVIWGTVIETCEAPDFLGLHKNKNFAFPVTENQYVVKDSFSTVEKIRETPKELFDREYFLSYWKQLALY